MSSYYEIVWREDKLDSYPTDKLNFIFNTINRPLPVQYRHLFPNRVDWQKAQNKHEALIKRVKTILDNRSDAHNVRNAWLKQHEQTSDRTGYTAEQLANKLPHMASQLGAFMEIENIEIKYFDNDYKPRYELSDFADIFANNYTKNGFLKTGMTKEAWLKLYPQINKKELDDLLLRAGYEVETENGIPIIPYWYAVNAKRVLIDGDSFEKTFDY